MTDSIKVTVNDTKITTYTTYNPYTGFSSSGSWYYVLINGGTSSTTNVQVKNQDNSLTTLYFCLIGGGGAGGATGSNATTLYAGGTGGGGGAGSVLLQTWDTTQGDTWTIYLATNDLSNNDLSNNSTITCSSSSAIYSSFSGLNGGNGGNAGFTTYPTGYDGDGGNGGNGGNGTNPADTSVVTSSMMGSAGGNGALGVSYTWYNDNLTIDGISTSSGTKTASNGTPGICVAPATGSTTGSSSSGYSPVTFADGQTANIAKGGVQGQGANYSAIMIYYQSQ